MLRQSFSHFPGIGAATEQRLWEAGFDSWEKLLAELDSAPLAGADRATVRTYLEFSIQALESDDCSFLQTSLGLGEAWRAWEELRSSCVYLDIETDGGSGGSAVTVVGLYDGSEFTCLVRDKDLDELPDRMAQYKMVVTFYGANFDLPMLERRFTGYKFKHVHLDLCPTLRKIGYKGGLKSIERQLGIARGDDTEGLGGLDAIKLWQRYSYLDDESALERLIAYNREDVVNLETLSAFAYDRLRTATLLGSLAAETSEPRKPRAWPPPSRRR